MGVSICDPVLFIGLSSTEQLQEARDRDDDDDDDYSHREVRVGECLDPRGPARRNPRREAETDAGKQPRETESQNPTYRAAPLTLMPHPGTARPER